jgi:hypothetical protein
MKQGLSNFRLGMRGRQRTSTDGKEAGVSAGRGGAVLKAIHSAPPHAA